MLLGGIVNLQTSSAEAYGLVDACRSRGFVEEAAKSDLDRMAEEDEALALELHKQLNAIPLRTRRGHVHELAHQQSLDKLKRDKSSRPRSKRTNSSSQDLPDCKKQRTSDPEGHTSARQRPSDHDPNGEQCNMRSMPWCCLLTPMQHAYVLSPADFERLQIATTASMKAAGTTCTAKRRLTSSATAGHTWQLRGSSSSF